MAAFVFEDSAIAMPREIEDLEVKSRVWFRSAMLDEAEFKYTMGVYTMEF